MKRSASFLKNIAALIMLLALVSLLLPFCNVTTPVQSTSVSGMEVMKIGAGAAKEYYSNGHIDNNYVLKDNLTWGALKGGVNYASEQAEFYKIIIGVTVLLLPVLLCLLAMFLTFLARGKVSMLLPTLFIAGAFLENVVIILGFSKLQELIFSYTNTSGVTIKLLTGVYVFTLLCGIALGILLFLWITGGFRRPRRIVRARRRLGDHHRDSDDDDDEDEDDEDDEDEDDGKKRSDRSSKKDKKNKKNDKDKKDKKDRKKRSKSRDKKKKKDRKSSNNKSNNEKQKQNDTREQQTMDQTAPVMGATGKLTGENGMYQGAAIDLAGNSNGMFTVGTTPEVMNKIMNGTIESISELDGCSCLVQYDKLNKQYKVMSRSTTDLFLKTAGQNGEMIHLSKGELKIVGAGTKLVIGDENNIIRLD